MGAACSCSAPYTSCIGVKRNRAQVDRLHGCKIKAHQGWARHHIANTAKLAGIKCVFYVNGGGDGGDDGGYEGDGSKGGGRRSRFSSR